MGVVSCSVLFEACSYGCGLPMAAAVTAATTVEAATAAVDSSATVEAATATHRATAETAANRAASCEASATVEAVPVPAVSAAPTTSTPTAAEPRSSADEQATGEVARAVVAVRRARVRVIAVVAVGADGSRTDIAWANAHAYREALSAGVWRECQGRSKYRKNHEIFHQVFHIWAPSEPVKPL
jgi:hypothetical protein